MLCAFVENLQLVYGGANTVEQQLGYPSKNSYVNLKEDCLLPLGPEFQQLVAVFVDQSAQDNQVWASKHFLRASFKLDFKIPKILTCEVLIQDLSTR